MSSHCGALACGLRAAVTYYGWDVGVYLCGVTYATYSVHSDSGSLCGAYACVLYTPVVDSLWAIGSIYME